MFVFYDFETTGTSPAFDQPVQFAAILTDDDFNETERVRYPNRWWQTDIAHWPVRPRPPTIC